MLLAGGLLTILGDLSDTLGVYALGALLFSPAVASVLLRVRNSRTREDEADYIGLLLMTEAGYDPAAAVTFWEMMDQRESEMLERLQQQHGKDKVRLKNEWESTHPHVSLEY